MTLLIPHRQGWKLTLPAVLALLMIVQCVWAMEPETCYSRQHQRAIVNVRQALTKQGVLMDARVVRSERDCVLACCSEEVKPGAKCNMAVFNGNKQPGEDNCFLFHCVTEQDCPLMKAADGINTYDIYKGLIHLTTARPTATTVLPITSTPTPRTTSTPPTTTTTTTTTTTSTTTQTPTTMPPPTTTQSPTTTPASESEPPPRLIIISPIPAVASTTTTTTTEVTSISIRRPNKTSKKQNKNTKKGRLHPVITKTTPVPTSATTTLQVIMVDQEEAYRTADKPQPKAELCTTTPPTTTTTTTPATTTTTTTPMPTTTTTITSTTTTTTTIITSTAPPPTTSTATVPPTTSTTTKEKFNLITTTPAVSLLIVPKGVVQPEHPLQDQSQAKSATLGRGAVKSGVVAFMVLGLAVLTMALAIGGRKAMESFDRRHYTRLELNDLHYEV